MKTMWKYLLLFTIANIAKQGIVQAQVNLVPNPSFEVYSSCPNNFSGTGDDQVSRANGWSTYRESSDYFNSCGTIWNVQVPNNQTGYQYAHTGSAYCGLITWDIIDSSYREIVGRQLSSPLSIGQKYYISFFTSLGGKQGASMASDKIGIKFSTIPFSYSNPAPINNSAVIYSPSIITDTTNWIMLSGSFIADSSYQYILIGNFFDSNNTDTVRVNNFPFDAYYYVDDICVCIDSTYASTWTTINEQETKTSTVTIYPNPSSDVINFQFITDFPKKILLYDNFGRIVMEEKVEDKHEYLSINSSKFSQGIYNAKIEYSNYFINQKIIIINHKN